MARCRLYDNASPPSVNGVAPPQHYAHDDLSGGDRPAKRSRYEEDHDDCIDRLPDDVLIGIISRLPIRAAVATGAVSATVASPVEARPQDQPPPSPHRRPAPRGVGVGQRRVAARGRGEIRPAPPPRRRRRGRQARAMEFAASARTLELHLSLTGSSPPPHYDFPHWRFPGGRLQRLRLCDVGLAAAAPGWTSLDGLARLTHLDLTRVAVDDAGVASVLAACAALIILEVNECAQLVNVAAAHGSLLVLSVRCCAGLKSVAVESSCLLELAYDGHNVHVDCRRAPAIIRLVLYVTNGCPLDCVATGGGALPKLRQLFLRFPSPLISAPRHARRVEAYGDLPVPPPNKQAIQWPERCSPKKLQSIAIGGFSGEPELMELAFFLLQRSPAIRTLTIDKHRRHVNGRGWRREEAEDTLRCYYARGVVWTHAPGAQDPIYRQVYRHMSKVNFTVREKTGGGR
ncbi:unnamed protein product [Urochloa decumbens]|uniref:At1g61320/AtMIF1 LRR domain-containing protein n=1 Tax=Urochloa decumbens TaxID=240449 RepID=A0ABC8WNJ3_9POAL